MAERYEEGDLKIAAGMFEQVIVRGIREHKPNRYGDEQFMGQDMYRDLTGWVRWEGERRSVQSAFWCDCLVWEFADE